MVPEVEVQMDAFWSANFGAEDPTAMMKQFADRITLVHLKDGVFEQLMLKPKWLMASSTVNLHWFRLAPAR